VFTAFQGTTEGGEIAMGERAFIVVIILTGLSAAGLWAFALLSF
jgi:hypothetical protein